MALLDRFRGGSGGRVARKDRTGADPFKVGAGVLIAVLAIVYLGFTKHIPFTHGFQVKVVAITQTSVTFESKGKRFKKVVKEKAQ